MSDTPHDTGGLFASKDRTTEDKGPATAKHVVAVFTLLLLFFLFFISVTPVNEMARAGGVLRPDGGSLQIEHASGGSVASVHVVEGQTVTKDQVLAVLSSSDLALELDHAARAFRITEERLAASLWLLDQVNQNPSPQPIKISSGHHASDAMQHAQAKIDLHRTTLDLLSLRARELEAKIPILRAAMRSAQDRVALMQRRQDSLSSLQADGHTSTFRLLEAEERLQELAHEAASAQARAVEAEAQLQTLHAEIAQTQLTFREAVLKSSLDLRDRHREVADNWRLLKTKHDDLTIRAPQDGLIQSVVFPNPGEVIAPGDGVFDLVPAGTPLVAEIELRPGDIGHVREGARVEIKVTSFDFRKYGGISGWIQSLSPDRVEAPDGTSHFRAYVVLDRETVGGGTLQRPLRPGMDVTAEIQTDSRTILQFLFKPIDTSLSTAFAER